LLHFSTAFQICLYHISFHISNNFIPQIFLSKKTYLMNNNCFPKQIKDQATATNVNQCIVATIA
jgi:hypothetical protein